MFLEKCSVSFIVRSPSSSYIRSSIAASVVNIVLAICWNYFKLVRSVHFLEVTETALKTVFFCHHASLFNRSWSWNSCQSFVRVKIYRYNVGFAKMSVQWGLFSSNIHLLWDFGMYSFDDQYWEIFRNNSPIFLPNSFHQAKVCVYLGPFLVLSGSLDSMSCLFSF